MPQKTKEFLEPFLEVTDFAQSKEVFSIVANAEKNLLQTKPVPSDLEPYYSQQNYISHQQSFRSFSDKLYALAKKLQHRKKEKLILKYLSGAKKILDFGSGSGDFVRFLQDRNWHVLGVEPNQNARAVALENNTVLHPSLGGIPKQQFNVISLWHVLEHLPDYNQTLQELLAVLAPGGTLVLALPNFKSWDAGHYKSFWAAYDVPRHLWHFSKQAMEGLATDHGLEWVQSHPMPLDAFYVSLLSEKFKQNPLALPTAFLKGAYSNLKAKFNGEYSSLIYVFKKPE